MDMTTSRVVAAATLGLSMMVAATAGAQSPAPGKRHDAQLHVRQQAGIPRRRSRQDARRRTPARAGCEL